MNFSLNNNILTNIKKTCPIVYCMRSYLFSMFIAILFVALGVSLSQAVELPVALNSKNSLEVVWNHQKGSETILSLTTEDLEKQYRMGTLNEKLPKEDQFYTWKGVVLQELVEKSLESLSPESKAQIDLLMLKNQEGDFVLIPRALITKYPLLLAIRRSGVLLPAIQTVVPWNSRPKIQEEFLPLSSYFLRGLNRVELGNYRELYRSLYLNRRSDPSAMRGEKIFIQNCASCHSYGKGPSLSDLSTSPRVRTLSAEGYVHSAAVGMPKMSSKDHKALVNYLEAYLVENPGGIIRELPASASAARPAQNQVKQ